MKKLLLKHTKVRTIIILVFIGASCVSPKKMQEENAKYTQLSGDYLLIQDKYRDLDKAKSGLESKVQKLEVEKNGLSVENARTTEANYDLQAKLSSTKQALTRAERENTEKDRKISELDELKNVVVTGYKQVKPLKSPVKPENISVNVNRPGDIIFYAPESIREGSSANVTASLGVLVSVQEMKKEVLKLINNERKAKGADTITADKIEHDTMNFFDSVKIELTAPEERMKVEAIDIHKGWRKLNNELREIWNWRLTPKENQGGKAPVDILLTVYTKGKNAVEGNAPYTMRTYQLKIELPETMWQAFLRKLRDMGWVFATVGSIIGFIIGFWKKKKE